MLTGLTGIRGGAKAAALAMALQLIESAQRRWRMVNAPHLVARARRRHIRQRQARRAARRSVTRSQQPAGCSRGGGCQRRLKDLDPQVLTITPSEDVGPLVMFASMVAESVVTYPSRHCASIPFRPGARSFGRSWAAVAPAESARACPNHDAPNTCERDSVHQSRTLPTAATCDPLVRRHSSTIAGSRLLSPDEAFSCRFDRGKSRGVAQSLSLLAPCLAP